ncbi:ABC transporter permease [Rossellomorea aquimaris]|uniref:ABC transporter permease n=1 Tax=Rossellomorea aquimaris TaxID=189382 RepID=UPI001CD65A2F|nr:ABC transporter permease [Rossellomorea aquimaris]MCA1060445.1 ABC transporter permease [Rossellomorea aquimaris]
MNALIRYHVIHYLRSFTFIPPLTIFIFTLMLNYTYKPNPIYDSYSFTSLALFFMMGWFTVTVFHSEDQGQKEITLLHTGSQWKYHLALYIVCVMIALLLSLVSVLYPIVCHAFGNEIDPSHFILGFLSHFCLAILSIGLSTIFTRELVRHSLNTWWGVLSVLILSLAASAFPDAGLLDWLYPPVELSLTMMSISDGVTFIPVRFYWEYGWIMLYGFLFVGIYFVMMKKKRH